MTDFIERIVVRDRYRFGQKVMDWAEGAATPASLAEAEVQLNGILQFPLPDYITDLRFIPTTKEVWTIKVPPADMLQDTRNRINAGEAYHLPEFYGQRVTGHLPDNITLFRYRVGDYTCALCA